MRLWFLTDVKLIVTDKLIFTLIQKIMIGFIPELIFDSLFVSAKVGVDILLQKRDECI